MDYTNKYAVQQFFVDVIWFIIKNPPEVNHDGLIEIKNFEAE